MNVEIFKNNFEVFKDAFFYRTPVEANTNVLNAYVLL